MGTQPANVSARFDTHTCGQLRKPPIALTRAADTNKHTRALNPSGSLASAAIPPSILHSKSAAIGPRHGAQREGGGATVGMWSQGNSAIHTSVQVTPLGNAERGE